MKMKYIALYNTHAGDGWNDEKRSAAEKSIGGECSFCDMTKTDYASLFGKMTDGERLVLIGGDGTLSLLVWHGKGKLKTLSVFPSIFKGEHVSHGEMCEVLRGREIEVEFSAPTDLQIDGETVKNVTHYAARSYWGEKADALSTSSGAALA